MLLTFLKWILDALTPPAARVTVQCSSFIVSAWLMTAADLGIADSLKDGPKTAQQLASDLGVLREDDLYRCMRMLSSQGFFKALPGGPGRETRFCNNAASATLREDHPNSVKHLAMTWHRDAFSSFSRDVMLWHLSQPGEPVCAFEKVHGRSFWDHMKANPASETIFSRGMRTAESVGLPALLQDFDWSKYKRIIDVGGANGSALSAIMQKHPQLQGVLFDQAQVIQRADEAWRQDTECSALRRRVSMVGGNFFKAETLPPGRDGDVFFLRSILHDWSDDLAVAILLSLRRAIGNAKVTLALGEMALLPEHTSVYAINFRYVADMLMHAVVGGKERTEEQFKQLLSASSFRYVRSHETRFAMHIIEAVPA